MCGVSGRRMGLSQARGELSNQSCWSCLAPVGPLLYRPEQLHMLLRDPVAGHSWPGIMDGQPEPWDTVNLMSLFELSPFVCSQYFLVASSIYKYVRTTGLLPYNQPAGGMLPNASKPPEPWENKYLLFKKPSLWYFVIALEMTKTLSASGSPRPTLAQWPKIILGHSSFGHLMELKILSPQTHKMLGSFKSSIAHPWWPHGLQAKSLI